MRRRLASATNPVHRHSLLQVLVDGALVALAYYLAFRLRFDGGVPNRYEQLLQTTIVPVVIGTVVIFALSGMYQRWWRFLGQRDYERLLRGVVIATLAALASDGEIDATVVADAIKRYDVNPNTADPRTR